jgi:hypothetical protein
MGDETARRLLAEIEDMNARIRERLPASPFTPEQEQRIEMTVYPRPPDSSRKAASRGRACRTAGRRTGTGAARKS